MTEAAPVRDAPSIMDRFSGSSRALSSMRAPLVMSVVTVLALWLPEQVREVYRVLLQRGKEIEPVGLQWQWIMAAVSLLLLSIVLWQAARELSHLASAGEDLDKEPIAKWLLDWIPRVLAATPFIGAGMGLWYSFLPDKRVLADETIPPLLKPIVEEASRLQSELVIQTIGAFAAAALMFAVIGIFERWLLRVGPGRKLTETRGRSLFLINNWFLFPLIGLVSMIAIALYPMLLPQYFGVVPIFALWVAITTIVASAGTRFHDRFGIPIVTIAIVAVFVFQFLGWSDNHQFRHDPQKTVTRVSVDEAFANWIASRKDASAYDGKEYPVYIVAAEGGGIYAAQHAAKILARIQDLCPNFAQHVFAISGVSGGSLGGALFTALAQTRARNTDPRPCKEIYEPISGGFESEVDKLLAQDFLSPLVWAALFPDFVQRFLPVPIYALDRAVMLEKSFEHAWDLRYGGDNPFRNSLFALCGVGARNCAKEDVAAPALLINTTNVETGAQMILSPLYFGQTYIYRAGILEDFYRKSAEINHIPLSTAVGLSARFPWILPVGWYDFTVPAPLDTNEPAQHRRMTFVDGGYYEGSGVATAENLTQYLLKYTELYPEVLNGMKIAPKVIMITGSYQPVDNFYQTKAKKQTYDELTAPLSTLLMAWRARSSAIPEEAEADRRRGAYTARSAQFNNEYLPLPVGWQIAELSRKYLDLFTGRPQDCVRRAGRGIDDEDIRGALRSINENDCLVRSIIEELRGQPGS